MTLAEARTKLRRKVGNPTTDAVPDTTLTEHLNSAHRDLSGRYRNYATRKRCTFNTVAGTARYQVPSDLASVRFIRDTSNYRKLHRRHERHVAELSEFKVTENGYPTHYARLKNYIELIPAPDSVYVMELYYTAGAADLTADDDEFVTPASWDDGIVLLARWYYYDEIQDLPKAQYAYNAYKLWLSDKPNEVDEELEDADSGVEIPTLQRGYGSYYRRSGRFDDGTFDFGE